MFSFLQLCYLPSSYLFPSFCIPKRIMLFRRLIEVAKLHEIRMFPTRRCAHKSTSQSCSHNGDIHLQTFTCKHARTFHTTRDKQTGSRKERNLVLIEQKNSKISLTRFHTLTINAGQVCPSRMANILAHLLSHLLMKINQPCFDFKICQCFRGCHR